MSDPVHDVVAIVVHIALATVGCWLIAMDVRTHRLPNRIILPTLGALVALVVFEAVVAADGTRLSRALIGCLGLSLFYLCLHLLPRQGMGGGDVKLAAVIGLVLAWHGWQTLLLGSAVAFLLGAMHAIVLMSLRRATGRTRIAFGPWMILGAALVIGIA